MPLSFTPGQCRAARALIGWSQDQLATASKVAKATIANFETSLRLPQDRTLDELRDALEAAGVEFTNGGQPGVRMKAQVTSLSIDLPQIVSSSQLSVRLRSRSPTDLLVIVIERQAIDDYFHLSSTSTQFRRDIVSANMDAIARIADDRYVRRIFSIGTMSGSRFVQIVLKLEDLRKEKLTLPAVMPGTENF